MQKNVILMVFVSIIAILMISAGCISSSTPSASSLDPNSTIPLQTVKLNVCAIDGDDWKNMPLNLWDLPGESRTKITGKLAACDNIPVTLLEENGEYIKIKSGSNVGWVLRMTVLGK